MSVSRRAVEFSAVWLKSAMLLLVSADCESYCKPVKGNLKINMKKYCKKDYGKTASGRNISVSKCSAYDALTPACFSECVHSGPSECLGYGDNWGLGQVLGQCGFGVQEPRRALEARWQRPLGSHEGPGLQVPQDSDEQTILGDGRQRQWDRSGSRIWARSWSRQSRSRESGPNGW